MRKIHWLAAFGIISFTLVSCGAKQDSKVKSLSDGESFAVTSCKLNILADSGDSSGEKWSSPALESEGSWSIDTPIGGIVALRDELNDSSISASAAAQEDTTFSALAESTSSMASFVSQVVSSLQNEPWNRTNPLFYDTYYNTDLKTRLSACAGLSLRLNSGD